jgi:hypothetical protein
MPAGADPAERTLTMSPEENLKYEMERYHIARLQCEKARLQAIAACRFAFLCIAIAFIVTVYVLVF